MVRFLILERRHQEPQVLHGTGDFEDDLRVLGEAVEKKPAFIILNTELANKMLREIAVSRYVDEDDQSPNNAALQGLEEHLERYGK